MSLKDRDEADPSIKVHSFAFKLVCPPLFRPFQGCLVSIVSSLDRNTLQGRVVSLMPSSNTVIVRTAAGDQYEVEWAGDRDTSVATLPEISSDKLMEVRDAQQNEISTAASGSNEPNILFSTDAIRDMLLMSDDEDENDPESGETSHHSSSLPAAESALSVMAEDMAPLNIKKRASIDRDNSSLEGAWRAIATAQLSFEDMLLRSYIYQTEDGDFVNEAERAAREEAEAYFDRLLELSKASRVEAFVAPQHVLTNIGISEPEVADTVDESETFQSDVIVAGTCSQVRFVCY